jgi:ATP-binding protein involved in chromosome partitioning
VPITVENVQTALKNLVNPDTKLDLFSAVKNIKVEKNNVSLDVVLGYPAKSQSDAICSLVSSALKKLPGVGTIDVTVTTDIMIHAVPRGVKVVSGIKNVIAVSSGKGGVGKSTTAVNLALALAAEGASVGILDADIYGPSQPLMLGITGRPEIIQGDPDTPEGMLANLNPQYRPMTGHGLQASSIGFLINEDSPMSWRGPMATGALEQLLHQTRWEDLDYLIVDMPPGTGDIQLTMCQKIPLTAAVVITTPQDVALLDARKGLKLFEQVGVPILGIIENMSTYVCPACGHEEHVFGSGGGEKMSQDYGVDFLGSLPLNLSIRVQADAGCPTVVAEPDGAIAAIYKDIARQVAARVAGLPEDFTTAAHRKMQDEMKSRMQSNTHSPT